MISQLAHDTAPSQYIVATVMDYVREDRQALRVYGAFSGKRGTPQSEYATSARRVSLSTCVIFVVFCEQRSR
eukprot:2950449-Heterocapsa_arctica.AAC.1